MIQDKQHGRKQLKTNKAGRPIGSNNQTIDTLET